MAGAADGYRRLSLRPLLLGELPGREGQGSARNVRSTREGEAPEVPAEPVGFKQVKGRKEPVETFRLRTSA